MAKITSKQIFSLFHKHPNKKWHLKDIKKQLGVSNSTELRRTLSDLVDKGKLTKTRRGAYILPKSQMKNLFEGYLQITSQGYGFVLNEEGGTDLLIGEEDLFGAWDGDRVAAVPFSAKGRPRGEIVKILERKFTNMVGTLEYSRGYALLRPDEPRLRTHIKLLPDSVGELEAGTRVVAKLSWPEDTGDREVYGEVIETLGLSSNDSEAETRAVIIKHNLKDNFDEETLAEARAFPTELTKKMMVGRTDLREIPTFTIDGIDAKDFDDALSLERVGGRGSKSIYRIGVHIADVAHYVKEDSSLDKEAKERATSVYLPGRVLPMLPPELSNGLCSLVEGESRLSFSVLIELDTEAKVQSVNFKKTVIKSNARLTYEEVQDFFDGGRLPLGKRKLERDLKRLLTLSQTLRQERLNQGALDFDFTEAKVDFGQDDEVQIIPIRSNHARQLIEEFMLLANRLVAKELDEKSTPGLFRVHEEPSEKKLEELQKSLAKLGYTIDLPNYEPKTLQEIIRQAADKPEKELVNTLLLRSLKQARYSHDNLGHFGLAFENYLHFTSPIRRYPDLVVHRILGLKLKRKLTEKLKEHYYSKLPELAEHVSDLERSAEKAERELTRYYQALWAKERLGETFEGTISGVNSFGFFVALPNGVEGLVPLDSLNDDQYIYDEDNLMFSGQSNQKVYKLGQRLEICIANANPTARQIDLVPLDLKELENKDSTKKESKNKTPKKKGSKKDVTSEPKHSNNDQLLSEFHDNEDEFEDIVFEEIFDDVADEPLNEHNVLPDFEEVFYDSDESLPSNEQVNTNTLPKLAFNKKSRNGKRMLVFGKHRTK